MRQIDKQDTPGLGDLRPRQEPAKPAPKEVEIRPGIIRKSDGSLETRIAENEKARVIPDPWAPYFGTPTTWGRVIDALKRGG